MSVRTLSKIGRCRPIPTTLEHIHHVGSIARPTQLAESAWHVQRAPGSLSRDHTRGGKTKTVVKAGGLPQGALPPLPKEDCDVVSAKTYPVTLQQHLNNVRKFPDCIILTRVGDFYEMYFDQVDQYAHLVGLKKAKRKTAAGVVAMAGFQHWYLERYLKMFLDMGKQVAVSEQVKIPDEDRISRNNGPLYDRRVQRIYTPGTLVDESFLDPTENNYLLGVHLGATHTPPLSLLHNSAEGFHGFQRSATVGLSWVDLSSGDFYTQVCNLGSLPSVVTRIGPIEIVFGESMTGQSVLQKILGEGSYPLHFHQVTAAVSRESWASMLEQPLSQEALSGFSPQELAAANLVTDYVRAKLPEATLHLQPPIRRSDDEVMAIDKQSLRGLEIRSLLRDGTFKGSLLHAMKRTVTKSGARLLSQRIVSPSLSLLAINNRLDLVQEMFQNDVLRENILALLHQTSDTRRLLQKFSIDRGDADDLLGLAGTVQVSQEIYEILHNHRNGDEENADDMTRERTCLHDALSRLNLNGPVKVSKAIMAAIDEESLMRQHAKEQEDQEEAAEMASEAARVESLDEETTNKVRKKPRAPNAASNLRTNEEIWIMRRNASTTLKLAHGELDKLLDERQSLTARLRNKLKAESLTLQWTPKIGYFCHTRGKDARTDISKLQGSRSISETKSVRTFFLQEWDQLGRSIDDAKLRIRKEEERVFQRLRAQVMDNLTKLRRNAAVLDELDVACSSAIVARERNLIRPIVNSGTSHKIIGGRHPTVDVGLRENGKSFTSNDCHVGNNEKIYLITGPNMGGKSTYLRQNALITILAQTGCFVPADYAEIGLVDKIFSRVGSADNLYQDQSTFMVEMLETAQILQQATPRSLVIMDEVGRGTTPEDGVAVGYACLHHLHYVNKCRSLFATHFHALADMTRDFGGVGYYCTDVEEERNGSWAYVHKLRSGVNRDSHALKVARLAGMPEEAIAIAGKVLANSQRTFNPAETEIEERSRGLAAAG